MAAYRVRVALALKGIVAEEIEILLDADQQFEPQFLEVNPEGVVPALVDRGSVITQSLPILEYLDEQFEAVPLLPQDSAGRARVRALSQLIVADTHPLITHRVFKEYTAGSMDTGTWNDWCIHWLNRGLEAFEKRLSKDANTGKFCHGDSVTISDICLASLVLLSEPMGYSAGAFPTVSRIVGTCRELDPFLSNVP